MAFSGWVRGLAAAVVAAAFVCAPTTALAAGNSAGAHAANAARKAARAATLASASTSAPIATPAPAPAPAPAAPLAPAAAAVAAPVVVPPAGGTRPVGAVQAVSGAFAAPVAPVAVAGPAAPADPRPRPERITPALIGLPDVVLPPGPEGTRLGAAILLLPLLLAVWLWALVRTGASAWATRGERTRQQLAQQLGVPPAELAGLGPAGLQSLRDQVAFDELTGVARRAVGIAALDREASRARRERTPLSVAFIDVDELKGTNDARGHEAGDQLLRGVAALLTGRVRHHDMVFRFGGDEFVVVLPDTPAAVANAILLDVRERGNRSGLAFSYGISELGETESSEQLLARADAAQYEDKRARKAAGRRPGLPEAP